MADDKLRNRWLDADESKGSPFLIPTCWAARVLHARGPVGLRAQRPPSDLARTGKRPPGRLVDSGRQSLKGLAVRTN